MTALGTADGVPAPDLAEGPPGGPNLPGALPVGERKAPRPMSRRGEILYFALRTKKVIIGLTIIFFFLGLAIIGPIIRPGDPDALIAPLGQPPSAQWWFGTTSFGQDVFAQFVYGLGSTFASAIARLAASCARSLVHTEPSFGT